VSDCSFWPTATVSSQAQTADDPTPRQTGGTTLAGAAIAAMDSMWPGPTGRDYHAQGASRNPDASANSLASFAQQNWAGPKASDPEKAGPNMRGSKGDVPLPAQAMNWAGPAAQNHKGSSEGSIIRQDGKSRADILSYQAEQFFHPPSSPDHPTIAAGSTSSTDSPNSNQLSVKRKLNPIFVEALMRWPTGLSGFERQEMAWTRWWQLMPTFLSMLVSPQIEAEQQLELL
jgi:hypothetical protein